MKPNNRFLKSGGQFLFVAFAIIFFTQCHSQNADNSNKGITENIEQVVFKYGYKVEMSDYLFLFDNVIDRNTPLVSYLKRQKYKRKSKVRFPIKGTVVEPINELDTVSTQLFKEFAEYNSICMWALERDFSQYPMKKEKMIDSFHLKRETMIYCGQIALSEEFDSFIISLNDTTLLNNNILAKNIFIVNMKDDAVITSVVNLFKYVEKDNVRTSSTYVSVDDNKIFHSADISYPEEDCCDNGDSIDFHVQYGESYPAKCICPFDFKFDEMGQVVILKCEKDYYDEMNRRIELRTRSKSVPNGKQILDF
ncbi:MAG: hypothetical protein J6Y99_04900 [Bacteroidales bacterium]|nr:hypothetical protein [Bacteroidales bacterium]